jgi:hypothetical protein
MAEFILAHAGPGILAAATTACSLPSTPASLPRTHPLSSILGCMITLGWDGEGS